MGLHALSGKFTVQAIDSERGYPATVGKFCRSPASHAVRSMISIHRFILTASRHPLNPHNAPEANERNPVLTNRFGSVANCRGRYIDPKFTLTHRIVFVWAVTKDFFSVPNPHTNQEIREIREFPYNNIPLFPSWATCNMMPPSWAVMLSATMLSKHDFRA